MTRHEQLEQQKDHCRVAMERTSGVMRAIWESKYFYFENKIQNLTVEEAGQEV